MSAKYAAMEDHFINVANNGKEFTFKLNAAEKVCLDSFMESRNNKLLFSKGNFDENGRVTLHDELGRPKPLIFNQLQILKMVCFSLLFAYGSRTHSLWLAALSSESTIRS
jgi:hypothetical protein